MALFDRLFGRSAPALPPPAVDLALGDARARHLRARLAKGDWQPVATLLDRVRDRSERHFYCDAIANWPGRPRWLDAWVTAEGSRSALPWLVRGIHSVHWAWEARTAGRAEEVSEERWPIFLSRLADAERDLEQAIALDPADPAPHAARVLAAMGLSQGTDVEREHFDEATRRDRVNWPAHRALANGLCEKWGGSHGEMFAFAQDAAQAHPEAGLGALVAFAHVERWLYFSFEDDPEGAAHYCTHSKASEEVCEAWELSFGRHPLAGGRWAPAQRNLFAFAFFLFGESERSRDELRALQGVVTEHPWCYLGEGAEPAFARACRQCGA